MSALDFAPIDDVALSESIKQICKNGQYIDALKLAERHWGAIHTWVHKDKLLLAIRLYFNLGADRKSDAILLKLWRQDKTDPELIYRMLFYKINKFGPILAAEFIQQNEQYFIKGTTAEKDLLTFKSIIQRDYKNYLEAENCLLQASAIAPEDNYIKSQYIQLLFAQDIVDEAKQQAQALFAASPTPAHLRLLSNILLKSEGIQSSIALYQAHIQQFQSAQMWMEYAKLLSQNLHWLECEQALAEYDLLNITPDKDDQRYIRSLRAQIAIHQQDIPQAQTLLAGLSSGYWKTISENIANFTGEAKRKLLDVPFLQQQHMTCAPTTLAALAEFWGLKFDSKQIADEICFDGTPDTKERQWLRDNDFAFAEFELDADLSYALIDKNIPFALVTTSGFSSHIQAVMGYNKQLGTMYIMDPSSPVMQEMLIKETIEVEAYSGARCLAFVPKSKAALLDEFDFPASDYYPIYDEFSLAIENNDLNLARSALGKLQSQAPEHRLTLFCQRRYAIWNNDLCEILELNNKLLARFPNETVLLNSKYFCLRDLGQKDQAFNLLIDYLDNNRNLDLLSTLFDEIHTFQEYNDVVIKLLDKLKLFGSFNGASHWSMASYYWSLREYTKATQHYLIAHCLDETNSLYIESYFKASRFLKQQDIALQFLLDRFDKYKKRSPIPAMSLFKAYEFLDKEHLGVEYLFEALSLHPNDGDLLRFVAEKLIYNGLLDKFDATSERFKQGLSSTDYQEIMAKRAIKIGDLDAALTFYQDRFEQSPLVYKFANGYFQLLAQIGNSQKLDQVLLTLYQQHQNNSLIYEYISDWHSDLLFKEKVLSEWVAGRPHYSYARRQLINVKIDLGAFDSAVTEAKQSCALIKGDITNLSYLAKAYFKKGDFNQAKEHAKQVLSVDADNTMAFDILLDASVSNNEKQQALNFVFEQIKAQTIFGDGAWNFWYAAKVCLDKASLQAFVLYLQQHYSHLWYTFSLSGSYYLHFGELDAAKAEFEKGVEKFPLTPRLHFDLAQLHELQGNTPSAIDAYHKALEINSAWSEVAKRLADLYEKQNQLELAVLTLHKIIKHVTDDGVLYGYLANIEIKQGQSEQALQSLVKAVEYSKDYRWAWNQLIELCQSLKCTEYPQQLAESLTHKTPYKAHVWRDLAYVTDDLTGKKQLLERSLNCDAHFIPAYKDLAQMYIDQGEYKQAIDALTNTPWATELPIALGIIKAELFADIGQYQEAADRMEAILFNHQGYGYLWKKLYQWLENIGDKERYIACCHQHIATNPHEPDALCLVGENLLQHATTEDKVKADQYLKRAYELSPNDQYIVLTYVDRLLELKQYPKALTAIHAYAQFESDCYVVVREILILSRQGNAEQALGLFRKMIADGEDNYWCLDSAFNELMNHYAVAELIALFDRDFSSLTRQQAYFCAEKQLKTPSQGGIKQALKKLEGESYTQAWVGQFTSILEYWSENKISPPEKLIEQHLDYIIEWPTLVEQLSNAYVMKGHYTETIRLFTKVKNPTKLAAFCFYHYRSALQMNNRWDEATEVIEQGLKQTPDNTLHNMRLWSVFEAYRTGQAFSQADLDVIDYEELVENEKYVYSTLRVALALGDSSFEDKIDEITPLLRKCQQDYQATVGQYLAIYAQRLLKSRLKASIKVSGLFATLSIIWKLSNRF